MEIVWVTILSRVANQDDTDADAEASVVSEGFGVDPSLEVALSQQVMAGELIFASQTGWRPAEDSSAWVLEDESRIVGGGGGLGGAGAVSAPDEGFFSGLVIPSGQEVLQSAWPLAIMWPILFVFYQAEVALGLEV